jgi:4-aminobutyrate aminotransferase
VGNVRGLGLMVGVEIVDADGQPAPELREHILEEAFRRGLLLLGCGRSTIRLAPPLIIDAEDADIAVAILDDAIGAVAVAPPA